MHILLSYIFQSIAQRYVGAPYDSVVNCLNSLDSFALQVIGVDDAAAVEEHVCINSCHCFKKLDPDQWKHHWDEACPKCGEMRFKIVSAGPKRTARLVPRNKFWYFGLKRVVGDLIFGDAVWCHLRKAASLHDFQDFSTSEECARLKAALGDVDLGSVGLYGVGFDFCNVFQFCNHSSGVMLLR